MTERVKLWDKFFEPFLDEDAIGEAVSRLGKELSRDYDGKRPVFLVILNGSLHFASDLTRAFEEKCEVSFVKYSSYQGVKSTGKLQELIGLQESLFGRHVIIVEDIVDTGLTLSGIFEAISTREPLSIRTATLLYKPKKLRYAVKPDYVGFEIDDRFVVGYGMDYNGIGRNLRSIYVSSQL